MPPTTRSSTASTRGLGNLGRLPQEIRCLIYQHLLLADLNPVNHEPKFYKQFVDDGGVYHKDEWLELDRSGREVIPDLLPSPPDDFMIPPKLRPGAYGFKDETPAKRFQIHTNILCVSKVVEQEASQVMHADNLFVCIQWDTAGASACFTGRRNLLENTAFRGVPLSSRAMSTMSKKTIAMKIELSQATSRGKGTSTICPASELYRFATLLGTIALTGEWLQHDRSFFADCRMLLSLCDTDYLSPRIVSERLLEPFNNIFMAEQTSMYEFRLPRLITNKHNRAHQEVSLLHGTAQTVAENWLKRFTRLFDRAQALFARPDAIVAARECFTELDDLLVWALEVPYNEALSPAFTDEQLLSIHRMCSRAAQNKTMCSYSLLFVQEPRKRGRGRDDLLSLQSEIDTILSYMSDCQLLCGLEEAYPANIIDSFRDQLYTRADFEHMLALLVSTHLYHQEFDEACQAAYRLVKSKPENEEYLELLRHCAVEYRTLEGREWTADITLTREIDRLYSDPGSPFRYLQA